MTLVGRFWHAVVGLVGWLTLSPTSEYGLDQTPQIPLSTHAPPDGGVHNVAQKPRPDYPVFEPPTHLPGDAKFVCSYPTMIGWNNCSIPENRECWLRHNVTGEEINIHTNYEDYAPEGILRQYVLNVTTKPWNADGMWFEKAILFNGNFPGPLIEACWGDTIEVVVNNQLEDAGTSIHWHGIRQNGTMEMDGVNGITQCPIAPNESFTYRFKAVQYGTSWYHSHYSVQYADGLQGPMTIHGPTSAPFDTPKIPLFMSDWTHIPSYDYLSNKTQQPYQTILLDGTGDVTTFGYQNNTEIPKKYEMYFHNNTKEDLPTRPRRYLLRVINTSFESTFIFSIDNHWLQVVSADFVPIEPYYGTSVFVGIGQRYNVIVEAMPQGDQIDAEGNFWIRTSMPSNSCGVAVPAGGISNKTGILRYNRKSTSDPTSVPWPGISTECSDEDAVNLRPKIPWHVGEPANKILNGIGAERFDIVRNKTAKFDNFSLAALSFNRPSGDFNPLQIHFSNPTIAHLNETNEDGNWPPRWVIIPEDVKEDEWVYLALTSSSIGHPVHLHGHDFAILQQEANMPLPRTKKELKLNKQNPPRRDTVLVPQRGFAIIAFKADNPGTWLMHCHIAAHAAEGLAVQIMERQKSAELIYPWASPKLADARQVCDDWKSWRAKHPNFTRYEQDSGI